MREVVASTLIAALLVTGCGPLLPRTTVAPPGAGGADRASVFREAARKIPLGKWVNVETLSGERISGELRAAGETGVVVETPARTYDSFGNKLPSPTQRARIEVAYDRMQSIKRPASVGSWVLIGLVALLVVVGIEVS